MRFAHLSQNINLKRAPQVPADGKDEGAENQIRNVGVRKRRLRNV
jgi:hypothetical protein